MSKKITPSDDRPIANIAIYRLDIYRLLSFLLVDEKIAKNNAFQSLSNDYCESEVNRLLILTAAVTRQILDSNKRKYKEISDEKCGMFWSNYPVEDSKIELNIRKACHMIIHATDIAIKTGEYYYIEGGGSNRTEPNEMYFRGTINITGRGKNYAELGLEQFAQHCIELGDRIATRGIK